HVGAGVDPGGGVALEEDVVATAGVVAAAEEVVEAHLVHRGDGGVAGQVTPHGDPRRLCPVDQHRGVPAQDVTDLDLEVQVPGVLRLGIDRDRVDVIGRQGVGQVQILLTS